MKPYIIHDELYDFEKDINIQIMKIRAGVFAIVLQHNKEEKWQYSDLLTYSLKEAYEFFETLMLEAPINKQIEKRNKIK